MPPRGRGVFAWRAVLPTQTIAPAVRAILPDLANRSRESVFSLVTEKLWPERRTKAAVGEMERALAVTCASILGLLVVARIGNRRAQLRKKLQQREALVHLDVGNFMGADIGGTLTKIVYFEPFDEPQDDPAAPPSPTAAAAAAAAASSNSALFDEELTEEDEREAREQRAVYRAAATGFKRFITSQTSYGETGRRDDALAIRVESLGGTLHFIQFETARMDGAVRLLVENDLHMAIYRLACTGGGAIKFAAKFEAEAGINIEPTDELAALAKGLDFLLDHARAEVYTYERVDFRTLRGELTTCDQTREGRFPYLVVNIGSGVSILKVQGPTQIERVSGTSLGGGTYFGLCSLLTKCTSFAQLLAMCEHGDPTAVDMTVGDIYGAAGYGRFGLDASTVASSFGKMQRHRGVDVTPPREPDMARALLVMITQNIGQVAYLNAQVHGIQKIFFVGSFLSRKNTISSQLLAYAINFWSKGNMSAQFFRHEGYFGSIGSFLSRARAKKPRSGSMDCGSASGGKDAAAVVDGDGKEEEEREKAAEGSQSATTGAA